MDSSGLPVRQVLQVLPAALHVRLSLTHELCRKLGIACKEQAFRGDELNRASEIIITGTNKEITPIVRLDGRPVGTGTPGPVTRRVQAAYSELVRG